MTDPTPPLEDDVDHRIVAYEVVFETRQGTPDEWFACLDGFHHQALDRAIVRHDRPWFVQLAVVDVESDMKQSFTLRADARPSDGATLIAWTLALATLGPDDKIASEVEAQSRRLGGRAGFLRQLAERWPPQADRKLKVATGVVFAVDAGRWRAPLGEAATVIGRPGQGRLRQVLTAWSVEDEDAPVQWFQQTYPDEEGLWLLTSGTEAVFDLDSLDLEGSMEQLWLDLTNYLAEV